MKTHPPPKTPYPRFYSGASGVWFWQEINSVKNRRLTSSLYTLGLTLQMLEVHTLRLLNEALLPPKLKRKSRKKQRTE